MFKRILKIIGILIIALLLVISVTAFLLTQQKVQIRLAKEGAQWLSKKLNTKVSIDKVKVDFLNYVHFEGLYIEDQQQDTLAYIDDFSVKSSSIVADLWNDKTSIIKNVKLDGGVVNLLRAAKSDNWNFTFIIDAFANEDKDTSHTDLPKIDLKNVSIKNVRLTMHDKWAGQNLWAEVGAMRLKVNSIDLRKLLFNVSSLAISNTNFAFSDYEGGKPKSEKITEDQSTWGTAFNEAGLALILKNMTLENVNFEYQRDRHISTPGKFDERHILASNIQLNVEDFQIEGDTVTADIVNFEAQERSGLRIKKFQSRVKLNQQIAELGNLYLETNYSVVKNYYSMRYANFHDFANYIENVKMYGNFRDTRIDKRDIAFFSGNIVQLPAVTQLSGKAEGTVANLYVPNVVLSAPNLQYEGSARIIGLPDIDNTFFKLEASKLITTGNELLRIAPAAKTDGVAWEKFSSINFKGSFEGGIRKFVAKGMLVTNQGNADLDMFMDLNGAQPIYKGSARTTRLNIGDILKQEDLGIITASGTIDGRGFDFKNLKATVDASVQEMYFQGERYEQITLKGSVKDQEFNGVAISKDPNLGFDFTGKVNLNGKEPSYDFKSDIVRINLKTFGLTPNDVIVKAKVQLDFKGKNIDEFVGKAVMEDVNVRYDNKDITIPRLRLNSFYTDSLGKVLDLKSSIADARVVGQYSLTGIDKTIRSFLHYYMPTFIKEETLPENEIYVFDLLIKNANSIINIYEPKLLIDSGTVIKGDINTVTQNLNLTALIPNITYDAVSLSEVGLVSKGTRQLFTAEMLANSVSFNKAQVIENAKLNLAMSYDTARVQLVTNPATDFLGESILDFKAQAYNDRLLVNIYPSSFILQDDKYRISSKYPIEYSDDGIVLAKDVIIENGTQQFVFNAMHDGLTNNASLRSTNIDLEKISSYMGLTDFIFKGRVNLNANAVGIWGQTKISGDVTSVNDFRINDDTLGMAKILFDFDKQKNTLTLKNGSNIEHKQAFIASEGSINFADETINLNAGLRNMPIGIANKFIEELVDSLSGYATGNINITGPLGNPIIEGNVDVKNARLRVLFTGCTYTFADISAQLDNKAITFNPVTIYDQRANRGQALLTGKISHNNYDKYRLKLNASSDDFLGLNTNELSGELFYGYIPARFNMDITGAIDDITMDISARPLPTSKFYLPLSESSDAGSYDYITFKTLGRFQEDNTIKAKGASYFKMKMDIQATPDVLATIILDPNTQEKIEARGYGNISLEVDLGNEISMYNTFTVKEGIYFFNFRGLLPNRFILEEGGTITWNKDAYNAQLDMRAVYKTRVALYPLISNELGSDNSATTSDDINIKEAKRKEETHVIVDLTGPLSTPEIKFDITQPYNRNVGSPGLVKLQSIRQNQNEVLYQASMILLFNSFKPVGGGLDAGNLASTTGLTTISDMVGATLSPALNNVLNKLTGSDKFSLNMNYKNYSSDVTSADALRRNQFDIELSASLFNDRFILDFGNSLDFANSATTSDGNAFNYGGDFRGQYLLTPDGRYRLNAFRVSTYDYVKNAPVARGGVGMIYKKSFNSWRDLLQGKSSTNKNTDPKPQKDENKPAGTKQEEPSVTTTLNFLSHFPFYF